MREVWEPKIEAEYERGNYGHGWGFLGTPDATLTSAKVCFVGLNPGGGGSADDYAYYGIWGSSDGNVYYDNANWGRTDPSPIQKQLQAWHTLLGISQDESLCAQFVPFRSPTWNSLPSRAAAVTFASSLWKAVLDISPATLFVTMGKAPGRYLATIMDASDRPSLNAGWGKQKIDVWVSPEGRQIVGMPHPSRYGLFGRSTDSSEVAIASFRKATGQD